MGLFKYNDGKIDSGFYSNGNLNGIGRIHLHNGDIFDGYLKDGKMQGRGVFFQENTN